MLLSIFVLVLTVFIFSIMSPVLTALAFITNRFSKNDPGADGPRIDGAAGQNGAQKRQQNEGKN